MARCFIRKTAIRCAPSFRAGKRNLWVKWLRRIEVGDQPWHHREETSKYTDLLENGKARRFTYVMDAKSVITSPSPQAPVNHKAGFTVLSGLAWSGRGKIARVDVSLDGGRNWQRRQDRRAGASTRPSPAFTTEFDWDGRELLLQSRAMDETGYVQPSKSELRKVRGVNSIYHNNGIQTWQLHKNGEVENVEISGRQFRYASASASSPRRRGPGKSGKAGFPPSRGMERWLSLRVTLIFAMPCKLAHVVSGQSRAEESRNNTEVSARRSREAQYRTRSHAG